VTAVESFSHAALAPLGGRRALMDHLRGLTYGLARDGALLPARD
jgi:hypothetical protein